MGRSPKKTRTGIEPDQIEKEDQEVEGTPKVPDNPDGRGRYRRALEHFTTLKDEEKHSALRETWKEVAMGAALRAKALVATCSPKDFSMLYRVVMAGAVAIDKAYPPAEHKRDHSPALVVNMFGSLGQRAAAIAMPPTPETLVLEAKEETWPASDTKTTSSSKTPTEETSPTTKPSTALLSLPSPQ